MAKLKTKQNKRLTGWQGFGKNSLAMAIKPKQQKETNMKETSKWPKVVKAGNSSVTVYQRKSGGEITGYRIFYRDVDGQQKNISIADEAEAMREAKKKAELLSTFGARAASLTPAQIQSHAHCMDILQPFKLDVGDVVSRAVVWLRTYTTLDGIDAALSAQTATGKTMAGLMAKSVQDARTDFVAEHHTNSSRFHALDLERRLKALLEPFKTVDVSTIDTALLQKRLDESNGGIANYDHNRRVLSAFFSWCFCQKYHSCNPAYTPPKRLQVRGTVYLKRPTKKEMPSAKKSVFTPDELKKLLATAQALDAQNGHPYRVAMVAICCLAGLRTSEFMRLRWEDVDFENGRIIIGESFDDDDKPMQVKTSDSRRSHKMQDNLKLWLRWLNGLATEKTLKGYIFKSQNRGADDDNTLQRVCSAQRYLAKMAGVTWRQNAPRHSYISYRLVLEHPIAEVAAAAGTSPEKINSNYKSLRFDDGAFINERDAKNWFNILPK